MAVTSVFDIYNFFNSRDIAEHCKKINHEFTAIEMAYIIWRSQYKTIDEKHKAWQHLIDHFPDETLPEGSWQRKERSLHRFLMHWIEIDCAYIENFSKSHEKYIYNYSVLRIGDDCYDSDDVFYDNYEACLAQLKEDMDEQTVSASITKRKLYSEAAGDEWDIGTLYFNKELAIIEIDDDNFDDDWSQSDGFMDMWFNIPTPFEPGDLVTCNSVNGERNPQFILNYIPGWNEDLNGRNMEWYTNRLLSEGGDWTDMQTSIYDATNDGNIYWAHGPNYIYLEYPREEPREKEKFLFALSNYYKKEIDIEDFLNARDILRAEKQSSELAVHYGFNHKAQYLCGLISKKEFEKKEHKTNRTN